MKIFVNLNENIRQKCEKLSSKFLTRMIENVKIRKQSFSRYHFLDGKKQITLKEHDGTIISPLCILSEILNFCWNSKYIMCGFNEDFFKMYLFVDYYNLSIVKSRNLKSIQCLRFHFSLFCGSVHKLKLNRPLKTIPWYRTLTISQVFTQQKTTSTKTQLRVKVRPSTYDYTES